MSQGATVAADRMSARIMQALRCNCTVGFFCTLLGDQPGADVGPLISMQAKERVSRLIQSGVDQGAQVLLDGRNIKVKGYENGYFVGPTIIGNVTVGVSRHVCLPQKYLPLPNKASLHVNVYALAA